MKQLNQLCSGSMSCVLHYYALGFLQSLGINASKKGDAFPTCCLANQPRLSFSFSVCFLSGRLRYSSATQFSRDPRFIWHTFESHHLRCTVVWKRVSGLMSAEQQDCQPERKIYSPGSKREKKKKILWPTKLPSNVQDLSGSWPFSVKGQSKELKKLYTRLP